MMLVYERLIIQALVPDRLAGRVFGIKDALTAWAFGAGLPAAGALVSLIGARELLVAAGVGAIAHLVVSVQCARGRARGRGTTELRDGRVRRGRRAARQLSCARARRATSSAAGSSHWLGSSATTSMSASTTRGSNCVPAFARSSSSACSRDSAPR